MAVTGLILICFLLMHMIGNLKMFFGPVGLDGGISEFDHYAHWLKMDLLYPFLPKGVFIWIFRLVILACVGLHMFSAITLWLRAKKATPSTYEAKKRLSQTYASRTMRWGGVILAGVLIWHLIQFTVAPSDASPYTAVHKAFENPGFVGLYLVWMAIVCLHITHGFQSAFTTLGANTSPLAKQVLNALAGVIAGLIFLGFAVMPVAVLAGVIPGGIS